MLSLLSNVNEKRMIWIYESLYYQGTL